MLLSVSLSVIALLLIFLYLQRRKIQKFENEYWQIENEMREWQTLAEQSNTVVVQHAQEGYALHQENQRLKQQAILIDPHNALYIDPIELRLYEVFMQHGIHGNYKVVEGKLKAWYGNDRKEWDKYHVMFVPLQDGYATAWAGSRINPPPGPRYLIEQYELKERSYR